MQVLWVSHAVPFPPKAGFLLRAYHLLRGVALRHTVDLVAFIQEPWLRTIYGDVESGLQEARRELGGLCRNVHFLPIQSMKGPYARHRTAARALLSGKSYTTTWLDQSDAAELVERMARDNAYDLVHFDTIGLAPLARRIPNQLATMGHHNIESHLFKRRSQTERGAVQKWYFAREARLLRQAERAAVSRFAVQVTCSELDSERLLEIDARAAIECIPNGVDCDYFVPGDCAEKPNSLVFVGTLNWHPNCDAMLFFLAEVWPRLKRNVPDATLDIVGANAPPSLTELAGRSAGVTMHGFVPDVRPYISAASVFICPIMDGGGTKLKVLDAFAMGKTVLAHPIALEGIDATPGVDVEVAQSPQEFVELCMQLFSDPDHRQRVGRQARRLVKEKYSFPAIAARLATVFESAAKGAPR